jgi:hypothetical protein
VNPHPVSRVRYPSKLSVVFALIAQDPFAKAQALSVGQIPVKPAERRQQFGGGFGGPLIKDKLFYFLDYDQQKRISKSGISRPS